jgi:hypothetical protein
MTGKSKKKKLSLSLESQVFLYWPICLLPILGKILEKVLATRVREVYNSAGLDAHNQYGFKKGLSSVDAVRRVVSLAWGNIKYIAGIYVDFTGETPINEYIKLGLYCKNVYNENDN